MRNRLRVIRVNLLRFLGLTFLLMKFDLKIALTASLSIYL